MKALIKAKKYYALLDSVYHFIKSAYKSALPRRPLPPKELPRRRALPYGPPLPIVTTSVTKVDLS